jgi:hypothetical protein
VDAARSGQNAAAFKLSICGAWQVTHKLALPLTFCISQDLALSVYEQQSEILSERNPPQPFCYLVRRKTTFQHRLHTGRGERCLRCQACRRQSLLDWTRDKDQGQSGQSQTDDDDDDV